MGTANKGWDAWELQDEPSDDDIVGDEPAQGRLKRILKWVGPAIAVVLIAGAAYVLWDMATKVSFAEIRDTVLNMPSWRIVGAFTLTGVGLAALATYDLLALHALNYRNGVSLKRALMGSLIANVFANTLGFPLLSGGSARYRIYSMVGVSFSVVARLIMMSWVTMWSGIMFVLGVTLCIEPVTQIPVFRNNLVDRAVGVAILLALLSFFIWIARKRRFLRVGGMVLRMPRAKPAFGMIIAGAVDLIAAAGTLHLLLPPDSVPDVARYLVTYSVGFIAGMAANTPGGVGVFEATVVTGLGISHRSDVAAALILFRLIYFVVPLILALILLAFLEWRHRWTNSPPSRPE